MTAPEPLYGQQSPSQPVGRPPVTLAGRGPEDARECLILGVSLLVLAAVCLGTLWMPVLVEILAVVTALVVFAAVALAELS